MERNHHPLTGRTTTKATLKVSIPASLHTAFMSAIHNPRTNRPKYGVASSLVSNAIRQYLHNNGHKVPE